MEPPGLKERLEAGDEERLAEPNLAVLFGPAARPPSCCRGKAPCRKSLLDRDGCERPIVAIRAVWGHSEGRRSKVCWSKPVR